MIRSTSAARQRGFPCALVAFAALAATAPGIALATSQRTFVASYGSDASATCSLGAPCRSFNAAIAQTSPGGEVVILDTAGYGPMIIDKSLKVIGPAGVYGGISVTGGANPTTGVVINAADTDDVVLRGLDITGVPAAAPLPQIGIDIQNAGAVYIEKTSISNFTQDTSACVHLDTAKVVRLYIDDSFLRECRTAVYVNGNTVPAASSVSTQIDNTRIERGKNTGGPAIVGVWMKNHGTMQIRNSTISRASTGVLFETDLPSSAGYLMIEGSQIVRHDVGISHTKSVASAYSNIEFNNGLMSTTDGIVVNTSGTGSSFLLSVKDSQILHGTTPISVANSGVGHGTFVRVTDSVVGRSTNGILLSNTAADVNTRANLDLIRTSLLSVTNALVDASATNGGKTYVNVESSTLSNAATAVNTSGTSTLSVSIARSQIHNVTTVLNHGNGTARFDADHIVKCANDFVNAGSGTVYTFGNNAIHDIDNLSGLTYITPTLVPLR